MSKINDFGAKIGGARKDLWKCRGLVIDDISDMSSAEKEKYIIRDNIWPKPDVESQVKNGMPRFISYWQSEMRKTIFPKFDGTPGRVSYEEYISAIQNMKSMIEKVHNEDDIEKFFNEALNGVLLKKYKGYYAYVPPYGVVFNANKLLKYRSSWNLSIMKRDMERKNFCLSEKDILNKEFPIRKVDNAYKLTSDYKGDDCLVWHENSGSTRWFYPTKNISLNNINGKYFLCKGSYILSISDDEKECESFRSQYVASMKKRKTARKSRKTAWVPHQFEHLVMNSSSDRYCNISSKYLMDSFGIRGGEFGNWTNEKERQTSLNYTYDSFCDISKALNIDPMNVSLPGLSLGSLAIAFGARGVGGKAGFAAHYEPLYEVINLTKLRGAGSLGHEWAHALDHLVGEVNGCRDLATRRNTPEPMLNVVKTMCYSEKGNITEYYRGSKKFDNEITKCGHGYWSSSCEMFARAFACYLEDKLSEYGLQNDYLCGDVDSYKATFEGEIYYAYPTGDERKRINASIDKLINWLIETNVFQKRKEIEVNVYSNSIPVFAVSEDGQFYFG